MISTDICSSVLRRWWYTEHEEFSYMKRSNRFIIPDSDVFYLHQIPFSSLWISTQWINASSLRATELLLTLTQISHILIIQTDLIIIIRCCVERVCVDAVTGSCSGAGLVCVYQCHIRASAGRDRVKSVCLEVMISPGVWTALPPVTHSGTIT